MAYLKKRVLVPVDERDEQGKRTGKKVLAGGICTVEPRPNPILDIALQICVDKTPITINSLKDIQVVQE